jgi:hypothetical protein
MGKQEYLNKYSKLRSETPIDWSNFIEDVVNIYHINCSFVAENGSTPEHGRRIGVLDSLTIYS